MNSLAWVTANCLPSSLKSSKDIGWYPCCFTRATLASYCCCTALAASCCATLAASASSLWRRRSVTQFSTREALTRPSRLDGLCSVHHATSGSDEGGTPAPASLSWGDGSPSGFWSIAGCVQPTNCRNTLLAHTARVIAPVARNRVWWPLLHNSLATVNCV